MINHDAVVEFQMFEMAIMDHRCASYLPPESVGLPPECGSPTRECGSPTREFGSPNREFGSPNRVCGSAWLALSLSSFWCL